MDWQPSRLTAAQMEERRLEAGRLLRSGRFSQAELARRFGVTEAAVSHWAKRLREGDSLRALHARPHPGRPSPLSEEQWKELAHLLRRGARKNGFPTERWTLPRVARLVEARFGVAYHPHSLGPHLRRLGFSPQLPKLKAKERDEVLIRAFLLHDWPALKRGLAAAGERSSS